MYYLSQNQSCVVYSPELHKCCFLYIHKQICSKVPIFFFNGSKASPLITVTSLVYLGRNLLWSKISEWFFEKNAFSEYLNFNPAPHKKDFPARLPITSSKRKDKCFLQNTFIFYFFQVHGQGQETKVKLVASNNGMNAKPKVTITYADHLGTIHLRRRQIFTIFYPFPLP
jgi:hypothetical protein